MNRELMFFLIQFRAAPLGSKRLLPLHASVEIGLARRFVFNAASSRPSFILKLLLLGCREPLIAVGGSEAAWSILRSLILVRNSLEIWPLGPCRVRLPGHSACI